MKNFAKILPSRRFSAVLGSLVFVIALVWGAKALSMQKDAYSNNPEAPSLVISNEVEQLYFQRATSIDTDNDGLKDWEEVLWQTDAKNDDSDGDGTKDGEEIKENRDPRVAGPKDTLRLPTASNFEKISGNQETLTNTDIVARDFFSKYIQAKQSGTELEGGVEKQIASSVLSQTKKIGLSRIYGEGDLIIDKNDSTEALKAYGEKMGVIIKNNATWKENELVIIKSALENENEAELKKLDPIIKGYSSIKEEIIKVPVPQKAVSTHLALLNSIEKIIASLKASQNVFKDPITTLATFGKYQEIITELHRSFIDARALFKRNNITYSEKESGGYYANFADAIDLMAIENNKQNQ